MADGGVADIQVSRIIVDAGRVPRTDTHQLTAAIDMSNEIGNGGYVRFTIGGSVAQAQGP